MAKNLLVEDDEVNRDMLSRRLKRRGGADHLEVGIGSQGTAVRGSAFFGGLRRAPPRERRVAMTRILCVEDNQDNLFMLQRRLTRAGFEVTITTDGAEGVEWAKTLLPDLIVMDLSLPGLNGWEATRLLKSQPETKHIPIVVLSSHFEETSRARAVAAGCDAYETKPADFERLVGIIRSLLGEGPKP